MTRHSKPLGVVIVVILIYFMSQLALLLMGLDGWATRPPLWDPAAHTLDGIHFARAFRHLSIKEFLVQMHNSGMWPPVIPLLQSPFQLIFGESFVTARDWTAWMALPSVMMVFFAGTVTHKRYGLMVGTIAATLLAISPHFQEYCLQEMLEVPGIFFCMLTLFFYIRFLQDKKPSDWRYTCLSGIVLFFCKFNYAVIVMLPIVCCEFSYRFDFREQVLGGFSKVIRDVRWRGGFTIFVILYTLFLIYVHKVGINFEVAGHRIMIMRVLGNPTYLLVGIVIVRNLIVNRAEFLSYGRNLWQAPEPVRSLLRFDILPALVWLSYPVFFSVFFIFMFSESTRQNSFFSTETLMFYPGALVHQYAPHPILGYVTVGSLSVMLLFWRRLLLISRFLVGLTTFNIALTILHPNYQVRYLMTSVPMLYTVTGLAIVHLWEFLAGRVQNSFDRVLVFLAPALAAVLFALFPPSRTHLQAAMVQYTQSELATQAFAAICRESNLVEVSTLVGFSNFAAPSSIALQCYRDFPDMRREQMPTTMAREGFAGESSGLVIVNSHKIDRFFVMDYSQLGFDVGRLQEAPLLESVKMALPGDGYEQSELVNQGAGGFRISVYRKKLIGNRAAADR